ncbi:MAG: DEAD/DEAH box helicase [Chitinophagaceae bacterium]|nr:DEAD/DEAH box helicase [Chitinophagaceae bacterium]MBK7679528.1 DEAD/DEAH box helicase [Chitinophagaceae bacterium]MBK9659695.1 DEAD/DEAH box helicase [Chitinophagaceae bacterium]MBK9937849.1 DEAD/DEAH box helicase [Chitinophagaceae bacterium]MBL0068205.1 DEAD/DEAH box helicase [Chitinophagaceae bacterium]
MSFNNLQLIEPVLQALSKEGYTNPTPIQEKSIPVILQQRDLLGCAQTGTGKTAAFVIPILQLMHQHMQRSNQSQRRIKGLILTPTRELAIQIGESIEAYGRFLPLRHQVIFGGVSQHSQVQNIRRGVDILVATPGRLLDLMQQGHISLRDIQFFVLDEADRMLDMGFVHDVKRIIAKLPAKRQTLFFSATMPDEIKKLADILLTDPVKVEVTPPASTVDLIQQSLYLVDKQNKQSLLIHLLQDQSIETVLIFTQMKHAADKLSRSLNQSGIRTEAIHGNKSQNARQAALANFKNKQTRVLVATDIAARGIDIDELTHVVNYELPNVPETYVHRIGRTGRAGASGIAISFCDRSEKDFLKDVEKLIRKAIPVVKEHPFVASSLTTTNLLTRKPVSTVKSYRNTGESRRYGSSFKQRAALPGTRNTTRNISVQPKNKKEFDESW